MSSRRISSKALGSSSTACQNIIVQLYHQCIKKSKLQYIEKEMRIGIFYQDIVSRVGCQDETLLTCSQVLIV